MGLFSKINQLWSGADFWDKQENAKQQAQAQADDARKKREQQIIAQQRAQAQAAAATRLRQQQDQAAQALTHSQQATPAAPQQNPTAPQVQQPGMTLQRQPLNAIALPPAQQNVTPAAPARHQVTVGNDAPAPQRTGFWGHVGHALKIGGQTAVSSAENLPEVGLAAGRVTTGLAEAAGEIPHMVTAATATGTQQLQKHLDNPYTRLMNAEAQGLNTGVKTATHYVVHDTFDPLNRTLDRAAQGYENNVPGAVAGADVYNKTQIPINALAALVTLGAAPTLEGASAAGNASRLSKVSDFLNAPRVSNTENALAKTAQAITDKTAPIVHTVNAPLTAARKSVMGIIERNRAVENKAVDTAEAARAAEGAPTVAEDAGKPAVPEAPEVAPGVKSPNLTKVPVDPVPAPTPTPTTAPVPPPTEVPTLPSLAHPLPTSGAAPTGDVHVVPQIQNISPDVQKASDEAAQRIAQAAEAPAVRPEVPTTAPVETPIQAASKEAPTVIAPQNVATREMTAEEMAAKGMSQDQIDAVMARRANPEAAAPKPKEPTPEERAAAEEQARAEAQAKADAIDEAKTRSSDIQESRDAINSEAALVRRRQAMGQELDAHDLDILKKADELQKATDNLAVGKSMNRQLKKKYAPEQKQLTKELDALEKNAPPAPSTKAELKAQKAQVKADAKATEQKVNAELKARKAERAAQADGQPLYSNPNEAPDQYYGKDPRVDTSTPTKPDVAKSAETTPVKSEAPAKEDLQKGARENTTKSGKVSQRWVNAQIKAGANPEDLRSAIEKVEGRKAPTAVPEEAAGGIAKSGGTAVSKSGDVIEATSHEAAQALGKAEAAKTDVKTFLDKMSAKEKAGDGFSQKDAETAASLQKNFTPDDKEFHDLGDINRKSGTQAAQTLATRGENVRETGTEEDIVNHYVNRLRDNTGVRITNEDLKDIQAKVKKEVEARSKFNKAQEDYLADPTSQEKKAAALEAKASKDQARKESMIEEMRTTVNQKGGDRASQKQLNKLIDKLQKDANVWQMDYIDTSLLSSTGTPIANLINSGIGGLEEMAFGKIGAAAARKATGTTISGGNTLALKSQGFGFRKLGQEWRARRALPAKTIPGKMMNVLKNMVTTVNEVGNTQIESAAHSAAKAEYTRLLKQEYPERYGKGMTSDAKKELESLADYNATVDPRDLRQKYTDAGYVTQGMGAVLGHAGKSSVASLENKIAGGISSSLQSARIPKKTSDLIGKLTMRTTVGFPTIVARSAAQGARRVTGGLPTFIQAAAIDTAKEGGSMERAMLIKQGVKELGSGGAMAAAGYAIGQKGLVTGAYPKDKTTQDQWAKEGISEHSIKIGDNYHSIPRVMGPFAIPFLVGAQMGQNHAEGGGGTLEDLAKSYASSIKPSLSATLPLSQVNDNLTTINYLLDGTDKTAKAAEVKLAGNATRIMAPLSGALNQIAQSTTRYVKDTETNPNNVAESILNKVYAGLPYLNKQLPDKTSKDGTLIANTSVGGRLLGAQSTANTDATKADAQVAQANNDRVAPITGDKEIYSLLPADTQHLLDTANNPKKNKTLTDQNYQTIYKDVAKTTSKLSEEGKWSSYGKTLQMKLATQTADKTAREDDKALTQRQIKQADVLDKNKVDPKVFDLYTRPAGKGGISEADFKKMVDPNDDQYDPITARQLFDLDKALTDAGVSENTTGAMNPWTMPKYTMPKHGKGKGKGSGSGSGKNEISTSMSLLGSIAKPSGTTNSQKYEKLVASVSALPNLTAQSSQTNLKKKISVVKGVQL